MHILRFTDRDVGILFNEIFKVNAEEIKRGVKKVPAINENFKISSDILNLTLMYVAHRFLTSEYLSTDRKTRAAIDTALIFNYRSITAIINDRFRFPADERIAHRTYERLSNKFLLKKLGTWQEVMNYRAEAIVGPTSIHRNTLLNFNDDFAVVYLINDSQGRIGDAIKNIYAEFIQAHKAGDSITLNSGSVIDPEGAESFKDKVTGSEVLIEYVFSIISDRHSFVKRELVTIINNVVPTTSKQLLEQCLYWISDEYFSKDRELIETFTRESITHCISYIEENEYLLSKKKDIGLLLTKLKGAITSSRSTEDKLYELRETGNDIVRQATGRVNDQIINSARTAVILYLFLRAYTKSFYTN